MAAKNQHPPRTNIVQFPRNPDAKGTGPVVSQSVSESMLELWMEHISAASEQGGGESMDWMAKYVDSLDRNISELKAEFRAAETRMTNLVNQYIGEVRHLDSQRHKEIQEIRTNMDGMLKWSITTFVTLILGFLGIAAAIITRP